MNTTAQQQRNIEQQNAIDGGVFGLSLVILAVLCAGFICEAMTRKRAECDARRWLEGRRHDGRRARKVRVL